MTHKILHRLKDNTQFLATFNSIQNYTPFNTQEERDQHVFLEYLRTFDNCFTRNNIYGHFCASAFVVNTNRTKLLMVYHKIYKSWGWLGGHADGELNLVTTAAKEVREESGLKNITLLSSDIFTMDSLPVLGHVKKGKYVSAHVHLSCNYIFEAD